MLNIHYWPRYVAIAFLLLLACLVWLDRLSVVVLVAYLLVSVVTFVVYARDKSAARQQQWRTPEVTLHLLALCGGWPGALLAQNILRHKSQKISFRLVCAVTVLLNLAVFFYSQTSGVSI